MRTDPFQLALFLLDILFPDPPVCTEADLRNSLMVHNCKPASIDNDYFVDANDDSVVLRLNVFVTV